MGEAAVAAGRAAWRDWPDKGALAQRRASDARRVLQLGLAALWLLDGVLQYQGGMYAGTFPRSLAATAAGNPRWIAAPITWNAGLLQHHLAAANTAFATIQLLLGLGIAFRPTRKAALGASVAWSLAVAVAAAIWVFAQGFGGIMAGGATDPNSGPLLALLAVAYWPARPARVPDAPATVGEGTPA